MNPALWLLIVLDMVLLVLGFLIWRRMGRPDDKQSILRLQEEFRNNREEAARSARELREELAKQYRETADSLVKTTGELAKLQDKRLEAVSGKLGEFTDSNEKRLDKIRVTLDDRIEKLQQNNEKKLDQMRQTVDEKLQSTLEKRLTESFKLVSKNLEAVQKGLGEMQNLATGVGDLKRVLTNVKTRGTFGEVQLANILEEILTPDQYKANVQLKSDTRELVEFAVRRPGPDPDPDSVVWLPIDAKFPQEDYLRLLDATEAGDQAAIETAGNALIKAVQISARDIQEKYINPPRSTDFAILFLPTEGLYAEVLRKPGQVEELQRKYRVVVAGPTTLAALLSSLRMGFRTLAIEKRSSEVWKILAAVKTEFGRFGDVLSKVKRQLETASNTIDKTSVRTRAMARQLRTVEELPASNAAEILKLGEPEEDADEGDD